MYKCERCGYSSKYKSNLKNHLRRKRICKPVLKDVKIEKLLINLMKNVSHVSQNVSQKINLMKNVSQNVSQNVSHVSHCVSQNVSHVSQNVSHVSHCVSPKIKKTIKNVLFFCKFCNKSYKHRQSKYKHEKKCKLNSKNNQNIIISLEENKDKNIEIQKNTNLNDYIKLIEEENKNFKKEKEIMEKQIEELWNKVGDNNTNIKNYQININNYGNENLDYLTTNFIEKLVKIPYAAVPKLIKHIHFNPEHPENHNIKIPNKKEKFALIHKNGKWEYRNKKCIIENMVDNGYNILDCYLDGDKLVIHDKKKRNFIEFQKMYESNNKTRKDINMETELEILNSQKKMNK